MEDRGIWVEKAEEEKGGRGGQKMSRSRTAGEADVFVAGCKVCKISTADVCCDGGRL